jgi:phage FluMu protein Com
VKVSLEKLYHYNCDNCDRWWTVADIVPLLGKLVNCPHCGILNTIEQVTEHPVTEQAKQVNLGFPYTKRMDDTQKRLNFHVQEKEGLEFIYTNWKKESRKRRVKPIKLEFGSTEWHSEPQWLLVAIDLDKQKERRFAVNDIQDKVIKSALLLLAPLDLKTPRPTDIPFNVSAEEIDRLAQALQFQKFYYSIKPELPDEDIEDHRSIER